MLRRASGSSNNEGKAITSKGMEELVIRATDENLTSENWQGILSVCDGVNGSWSDERVARATVYALVKRLAHRSANVQMYTLELANALTENCSRVMHAELASRTFTEALARLMADWNTHARVKLRVRTLVHRWATPPSGVYANDTHLALVPELHAKFNTLYPHLSPVPDTPPCKPDKTLLSQEDRQREERELQLALELSLRDAKISDDSSVRYYHDDAASPSARVSTPLTNPTAYTTPVNPDTDYVTVPAQNFTRSDNTAVTSATTAATPFLAIQSGTRAASVSRVRALYDFTPTDPGELEFRRGDIITVLDSVYTDWWRGTLRGNVGIFPLNYVECVPERSREDAERDAQTEAEVLAQADNVEQLLALLSAQASGSETALTARDADQVTALYQSVVAIRPKLVELIGKYSQKKEEITQLNDKFIKARREYEALLDASMATMR